MDDLNLLTAEIASLIISTIQPSCIRRNGKKLRSFSISQYTETSVSQQHSQLEFVENFDNLLAL